MKSFVSKELINMLFGGARLKLELDYSQSIENRYLCTNILDHHIVYNDRKVHLITEAIDICNAKNILCQLSGGENIFEVFGDLLDSKLLVKQDSIFVATLFNKKIFYDGSQYSVYDQEEGDEDNKKTIFRKFIDVYEYLNHEKNEKLKTYVHMGLPKTGSKYLQKYVFNKIENIHYVDWRSYTFTKIVQKFKYQNPILHADEIKTYFNKYIDCIEESALLISDESFINAENSAQGFYSNICVIKHVFPNAKVLISLREQVSLLQSLYCQSIINGEWKNPAEFLKYNSDKKEFEALDYDEYSHIDLGYFEYHKILNLLEDVFLHENIKVIIYEKLKNDPLGYHQELYAFFEESYKEVISTEKVNRRPGKLGLVILKYLNPIIYIPNKQIGVIPNSYFYRYFSRLINRFEYQFPIHNVTLHIRRKNIMLRYMIVKSRSFFERYTVAKIARQFDSLYYKPAQPFSPEIINKLLNYYRKPNLLLTEKYNIEIEKHWSLSKYENAEKEQ